MYFKIKFLIETKKSLILRIFLILNLVLVISNKLECIYFNIKEIQE